MSGSSLILTVISTLVILSLFIGVWSYFRHRPSPRKVRKVLQSQTSWSYESSSLSLKRLEAIQEQYRFLTSDYYVIHPGTLKTAQNYSQSLNSTGVPQAPIEPFDNSIDEQETMSALTEHEVEIENINISVNNGQVFIQFSLNSPRTRAPVGRFLLFIRLCPQNEDVSLATRCYTLTFSGNEPVFFRETIPLRRVSALNNSVIDNVGDLRPGVLSSPAILCEIYLNARRLYSQKLALESGALDQQIMSSLK